LPTLWAASVCRRTPRGRVISAIVGDRLQGAGLVVGVHHGHQHRLGGDRGPDVTGVEAAEAVDRQVGDVNVVPPLQTSTCGQDRGMLSDLRDDVRSAFDGVGAGQHRTADGQRVGLSAAGSEHDRGWSRVEQGGDLIARSREQPTGFLGVGVSAGGVTEVRRQRCLDHIHNARIHRSGGVVVQVNRSAGQRQVLT
jgi:hypothetical protein